MLPFGIIALITAFRFPRAALAVAAVGLALSSDVVARGACDAAAPGIVGAQHVGYPVEIPRDNLTTMYADIELPEEMKFPETVGFVTTFDKDLFKVVFDPMKRA